MARVAKPPQLPTTYVPSPSASSSPPPPVATLSSVRSVSPDQAMPDADSDDELGPEQASSSYLPDTATERRTHKEIRGKFNPLYSLFELS